MHRTVPALCSSISTSILGSSRKIVLNRPKMMNVLNIEMCQDIKKLLTDFSEDSSVSGILMRGEGEKAFCAGGDVKNMYHAVKEKGPSIGIGMPGEPSADFFRIEYEMNFMLANSRIPQVSYWDGIVMGGGVGVSLFGDFRIATEKTLFAMPETAIGLFPDVGSSAWLPHIPRGLGTYIALTGCKLKGADLLYAGIATHCISSAAYGDLEQIMAALPSDRAAARRAIADAVTSLGTVPDLPPSRLPEQADKIERCFARKGSVEDIVAALEAEGSDEWAQSTLKVMRRVSPSSLKLTLQQLIRGKDLSLRECLMMEYRMSQGCMRGNDFAEGVRALLVDRDNKPVWSPASLNEVSDDSIDAYFADLGAHELSLPDNNQWNFQQ